VTFVDESHLDWVWMSMNGMTDGDDDEEMVIIVATYVDNACTYVSKSKSNI
jgi:hypothetical protein